MAKNMACERLEFALSSIKDPISQLSLYSQAKESPDYSSRLLHRWPTNGHRSYQLKWASKYVIRRLFASLKPQAWNDLLQKLISEPSGSSGSGITFEMYVLRIFREGGHTFEIKDLDSGKLSSLTIPRGQNTITFDTIPEITAGTLYIPRVSNFACVDLLLGPGDLFQITTSKDHPIKGHLLLELFETLQKAGWNPIAESRLIFIVPSAVYDNFKKQSYNISEKKVYIRPPAELRALKQYALKIDLTLAACGEPPGLQAAE
jgi:hypothetical protein